MSRHLLSQAELSKREAMMRSGGDGVTPTDQWKGVEQNRVRACLRFLLRAPAVCSPFDPRRVYSYIVGRLRNGGAPLRLMVQAGLASFVFWPRVAYVLSCPLRLPMTIKI